MEDDEISLAHTINMVLSPAASKRPWRVLCALAKGWGGKHHPSVLLKSIIILVVV